MNTLDYKVTLYAVRRINWDKKIEYWNFWVDYWTEENEFNENCIADLWIAKNKANEYNAELVPLKISIEEEDKMKYCKNCIEW